MSTADIAVIGTDLILGGGIAVTGLLIRAGHISVGAPAGQPSPVAVTAAAALPVTAPPALAPVPPPDGHPATAAFARTLQGLRTAQRLSTRALGEMAGLDGSTVTNAEKGRTVTLETAAALARALGVSVDAMIAGEQQEAAS